MKSFKKSFIAIFSFLAACIIMVSCSKSSTTPPHIAVAAPADNASVAQGAVMALTATFKSDKHNLKSYSYHIYPTGTTASAIVEKADIRLEAKKEVTITENITIPAAAAVGKYDIVLKAKDVENHEATFTKTITVTAKPTTK